MVFGLPLLTIIWGVNWTSDIYPTRCLVTAWKMKPKGNLSFPLEAANLMYRQTNDERVLIFCKEQLYEDVIHPGVNMGNIHLSS
jgi:hypothetical protein